MCRICHKLYHMCYFLMFMPQSLAWKRSEIIKINYTCGSISEFNVSGLSYNIEDEYKMKNKRKRKAKHKGRLTGNTLKRENYGKQMEGREYYDLSSMNMEMNRGRVK